MGIAPPPPPISNEEFNKRWEAGARTMKELDPNLVKWFESGKRQQAIVLFISIGLFLFTMCCILYALLSRA